MPEGETVPLRCESLIKGDQRRLHMLQFPAVEALWFSS
jgi:hypothetical protein